MRSIKGTTMAFATMCALLAAACDKEAPKAPPAPVAAAEPVKAPPPASPADAAVKPKMVANPDGLSLAERHAKHEAEKAKLADELAAQEKDRLLAYDRGKLPLHKQVFAFILKTRDQYDKAQKTGDKAKVDKLRESLNKPIVAMGKKMATIDPKGGNSNVTTDYDVMLNALANDYPEAIDASFDGDKEALAAQTAELDNRTKKVADWLAAIKSAKPSKGSKKKK